MTENLKNRPRLTAEDLDQIRANLDWQAMFTGLDLEKSNRKSKPGDWWALSPFRQERTPSFHMVDGGRWYDFSISEGGGAIELIQKLEDMHCFAAAQLILDRGWSWLPEKDKRPAKARYKAKETAHAVTKAIEYKSKPKNPAIRQDLLPMASYHETIADRGISELTAADLGIGYLAQGRSALRGRIVFQIRDARKGSDKDKRELVILSHLGRAVEPDQQPKYCFYEGFQKSLEILGQDRLWTHAETVRQIKALDFILVTEGPFDWAKTIEAGLLNVGALFGSSLSEAQANKLALMAKHHGVNKVCLAFDRDEAGVEGARKAQVKLQDLGLEVEIFDWERSLPSKSKRSQKIPSQFSDLADLESDQLQWLRKKGWL